MKILQMSDIHFGMEDTLALRAAEKAVAAEAPDALIVCGDLTQRGKRVEFEAARTWLDQFGAPMLVVAGNHDTPLLNLVERVAAPFERFYSAFDGLTEPLDIGSWRFVGLNTARGWQARRNWAEGAVDIDELVQATDTGKRTALVCHHPLVSPPDAPLKTRTKRGESGDLVLKRSDAALLLSGHVHAPSVERRRSDEGSYLSVTAGTLSRRLRTSPPSINRLTFGAGTVDIAALSLERERLKPDPIGQFEVH